MTNMKTVQQQQQAASQVSPHLAALDADDHVEIIVHRDRGGVQARVHAGYIAGRELKHLAPGECGALLLETVARCARAIHQAHGCS